MSGQKVAYNPWREFIENCQTGDNYFRSSEYDDLLNSLDAGYAAIEHVREQDERIRELEESLRWAMERLHEPTDSVRSACGEYARNWDKASAALRAARGME